MREIKESTNKWRHIPNVHKLENSILLRWLYIRVDIYESTYHNTKTLFYGYQQTDSKVDMERLKI